MEANPDTLSYDRQITAEKLNQSRREERHQQTPSNNINH